MIASIAAMVLAATALFAVSASGATLPITVAGMDTGATKTLTVSMTRPDDFTGSLTVDGTSSLGPARIPVFSSPVATPTGFTVNVTNYDALWVFTPSVSGATATAGSASGSTLPITVTGMGTGVTKTLQVTAARTGYATGTNTVDGSAADGPAPTPAFGTPAPAADGFSVAITNYDAAFTWTPAVPGAAADIGSISGSDALVTVTGMNPGTTKTLTVTTSRSGYTSGSATVDGTSLQGGALIPAFAVPVATNDGFTVAITNYDDDFTWAGTATAGGVVAINSTGNTAATAVVTGVAPSTLSTATITASRNGYASGSADVTATSLAAGVPTVTISLLGVPAQVIPGQRIGVNAIVTVDMPASGRSRQGTSTPSKAGSAGVFGHVNVAINGSSACTALIFDGSGGCVLTITSMGKQRFSATFTGSVNGVEITSGAEVVATGTSASVAITRAKQKVKRCISMLRVFGADVAAGRTITLQVRRGGKWKRLAVTRSTENKRWVIRKQMRTVRIKIRATDGHTASAAVRVKIPRTKNFRSC